MIHVKKNIRDSFQFVFFFGGGVGGGELQMTFKKNQDCMRSGLG